MTTNNSILTATYEDVIYAPLDAIHNNDSLTFVYKKGFSITKQIVITAEANEDEVIIEKGLEKGDKILLSVPENDEKLSYTGTEFIDEIKAKDEKQKKENEKKAVTNANQKPK